VREAAERIPDILFQLARPARYVQVHNQFLEAIRQCIPHGTAGSIDEVPCFLIGRERQPRPEVRRGLVTSSNFSRRCSDVQSKTHSLGYGVLDKDPGDPKRGPR